MAIGVADEALGNMRTVRAFAMEDEEERYIKYILQESLIECVFS